MDCRRVMECSTFVFSNCFKAVINPDEFAVPCRPSGNGSGHIHFPEKSTSEILKRRPREFPLSRWAKPVYVVRAAGCRSKISPRRPSKADFATQSTDHSIARSAQQRRRPMLCAQIRGSLYMRIKSFRLRLDRIVTTIDLNPRQTRTGVATIRRRRSFPRFPPSISPFGYGP